MSGGKLAPPRGFCGGGGVRLLLGIDVGGTKIALALGDARQGVRASRRLATEPSGDARKDLARIAAAARELLAAEGVEPGALDAAGVSAPGPLDRERGLVLNPPNLPGWDRAPVVATLEAELGCPVGLENDANAAALAEWRFGAGQGASDVVYLTTSTGLGGGLVLGGRLHRGVASSAGEVGHMPIELDGEPCPCGLRGCLEAYVGGAAWTRRLRRVTPDASAVAELAGGREAARPEHVVAAARQGDDFALAELERWNGYLAHGIATLCFVLAPERFLLGTIAVAAGEALCFEPLRAKVRARIWPFLADRIEILPAALGDTLPEHAGLGVAAEQAGEKEHGDVP